MSGYIQLGLSDIASGIARPFLRKSSARNSLPFVPFAAYLGLNVIVILCDCYILYHPASKSRKGSDQEKDHHPAPEAQNTVPKRTIIEPGEQYVQIIEKFKRTITNLRGQVEQMKAREYERGKRFPHPPHEHISYEFQHIYYLGSDWAKNFFTIQIRDFDISRFPAFGEQLKEVSWDNSDWGGMQHFNASHLVQAVLGNMICQGIFLSPFSGTPPAFRRAYQPMYDKMCAGMSSSSSPTAHVNKRRGQRRGRALANEKSPDILLIYGMATEGPRIPPARPRLPHAPVIQRPTCNRYRPQHLGNPLANNHHPLPPIDFC